MCTNLFRVDPVQDIRSVLNFPKMLWGMGRDMSWYKETEGSSVSASGQVKGIR